MENYRDLGFMIKDLSNQITRTFEVYVGKSDAFRLTNMQYRFIDYLAKKTPEQDVFQKDLEKRFNIRKSTVSGILDIMEREQLLTREKVASDARLRKIVLTEKACAIEKAIEKDIESIKRTLVRDISAEELALLHSLLQRMSQNTADLIETSKKETSKT